MPNASLSRAVRQWKQTHLLLLPVPPLGRPAKYGTSAEVSHCWQLVCWDLLVQQHSSKRNCRESSAHPAAVPVMHEPLAKPPTCCAALPGSQSP